MANNFFLRKLACDELRDTLFFASGERPKKLLEDGFTTLTTTDFNVKIFTDRKIIINDVRCNSISSTKLFIQKSL